MHDAERASEREREGETPKTRVTSASQLLERIIWSVLTPASVEHSTECRLLVSVAISAREQWILASCSFLAFFFSSSPSPSPSDDAFSEYFVRMTLAESRI